MHDLIGNSQDEAGAFLTVLPRRVFLHVDPTPEARAAVEWAAARLLVPDTDEVFLVHVPPPPACAGDADELAAEEAQFEELIGAVSAQARAIAATAEALARIDVAQSAATLAAPGTWCRPVLSDDTAFAIHAGHTAHRFHYVSYERSLMLNSGTADLVAVKQ